MTEHRPWHERNYQGKPQHIRWTCCNCGTKESREQPHGSSVMWHLPNGWTVKNARRLEVLCPNCSYTMDDRDKVCPSCQKQVVFDGTPVSRPQPNYADAIRKAERSKLENSMKIAQNVICALHPVLGWLWVLLYLSADCWS